MAWRPVPQVVEITTEFVSTVNPLLTKIRRSLSAKNNKTPYPSWKVEDVTSERRLAQDSLTQAFLRNHQAVNGTAMQSIDELSSFLLSEKRFRGYCDPSLVSMLSLPQQVQLDTQYRLDNYEHYQFGITRATAAIAESGTIVLNDKDTSCRLGALTPWVHVAIIDPITIVRTISDAIDQFGDDPNIIWVTGPSKTADVEGILIEGVHGPGIQVALVLESGRLEHDP